MSNNETDVQYESDFCYKMVEVQKNKYLENYFVGVTTFLNHKTLISDQY